MKNQKTVLSLVLSVVFGLSSLSFAQVSRPAQDPMHTEDYRPITRRVDTSKKLTGKIVWENATAGEQQAYLIVPSGDGKSTKYLLKACDDTCRNEVLKCEGQERCSVKGEVDDKNQTILAQTFRVLPKKLEDLDFDRNFAFSEVEPGEFTMGSPEDEKGRYSDEVAHKVKITKDFEIGKTEVTQSLWEKVMGNNPSANKDPNRPVTNVSWNDTQEFLSRLNKMRNDGYEYRLPTEAEWEYAARGGQKSSPQQKQAAYSFGNNPDDLKDYAWFSGNSDNKTQPVGSKKPNPLELSDMHGNVWEWTQDLYTKDTSKLPAENPVNLTEGSYRVLRGGSWSYVAQGLRSALRNDLVPAGRYGDVGFRLVRTAK